jgi:hypothetical protein
MELTSRQQAAIDAANQAMRRVLAEAYPEPADHALLFVCAVVGSFAALAHGELGKPAGEPDQQRIEAGEPPAVAAHRVRRAQPPAHQAGIKPAVGRGRPSRTLLHVV